jgi:mannan endo-1,4-beta-mannosidase
VLRGINKMIIWMDIDGDPSCSEIAKTGANAVRMVWLMSGTPVELDSDHQLRLRRGLSAHRAPRRIGDWSMLRARRLVDLARVSPSSPGGTTC